MFIVIAGVLVLGILGFAILGNKNSSAPTTSPTVNQPSAEPTQPPQEMTVVLTEQNNSKQNGVATILEVNGKVMVSIAVASGAADISQPAHIHVGACPAPGAVKYSLTNVVGGVSQTTLDMSMNTLTSQLPLAINIHKSTPQISTYVACGDLKQL